MKPTSSIDLGYAAPEQIDTREQLPVSDHEQDITQLDGSNDNSTTSKRGRGKARGKANTSPSTRKQPTRKQQKTDESEDIVEVQSDVRRKRRRLSQDAAADVGLEVEVPASSPQQNQDIQMGGQGSEDLIVRDSSQPLHPSSQSETIPTPTETPLQPSNLDRSHQPEDASIPPTDLPIAITTKKSPPKKMMQLRAGGRLASPVKKLPAKEPAQEKRTSKRGKGKKGKHLIVICHYSDQGDIGQRIDRILDDEERYEPLPVVTNTSPTPPKATKLARPAVQKPPHPFFSGKPKPAPSLPPPPAAPVDLTQSPRKTSTVTPGKLRAQRRDQRFQEEEDDDFNPPSFGNNRDKMISKQPGMTHAPWPAKGLSHIRGDFAYHTRHHVEKPSNLQTAPVIVGLSRKMKRTIPYLDPLEDLLNHCRESLDFHPSNRHRPDGFSDPPPSLRVPTRSLTPGSRIQSRVFDQLGDSSSMHPACLSIYDSIPHAMTPYDEGRSEVQAWAQKYAPITVDQVLQPAKEATILRDWMKSLTIMAVETSTSLAPKLNKPDQKPKKKRRKKDHDLDDFVVNSDEELNEMNELSEPDDNPSSQGSKTQKRSLVQKLGRGKLSNAILISGPSGCGKSAMIHAVAKELAFEVFEINSGTRRSGKDVLDRVGDMVENHLVQRHVADAGNTSADEDAGRLSDAFNKDLESGRQGTMGSFFKSKPKTLSEAKREKTKPKPKQKAQPVQQTMAKVKTPRSQKQSLILLEEIDVLFDEDKGFWQTVFTLIINSKRPVIMTCNDEDLVPIQAMALHAILRLSPPPVDIAVDYLLLIAAKEGHILNRSAVTTLYESKKQDLRGSIADLQLWCQMGVGDPRGGLSWIFQRWPPGTGIDEHGLPLRVTSEGTYQSGMGCFNHEPDSSLQDSSREQLLLQLWQDWGVDPRAKLFDGVEYDAETSVFADKEARLEALKAHERFSKTISDMDMFSGVGLPDNTKIDTTDPELPEKARSNYVLGMGLLQTPPLFDYSSMDTHLSVTCSHLASLTFNHPLNTSTSALLDELTSNTPSTQLTRANFNQALEPLAYPPATTKTLATPSISYTSLDGPLTPIATDIAPYVRSIAAFDLALEAQRAKMGVVEGGNRKARTTRAARSALEGGQRQLTRRERWFDEPTFDLGMVLETGGVDWPKWEVGEVNEDAMEGVEADE